MGSDGAAESGGWLGDDVVLLAELLNETHDVISVAGADRRQKWVSRALHRVLGYDQAPESFPADFVHPDDRDRVIAAFDEFVASGRPEITIEYRVRHADGSWRWLEATGRNRLADPRIAGVVSISRDVTARKEAEARLRHLATHDPLTDLPNRSLLEETLDARLDRSGSAAVRPVVFFIDADGFKAVNDTYGHAAGDEVLRIIGCRLRAALRESELVARYGGDEFVAVADLPAGVRAEDLIACRLRRAVSEPLEIHGRVLQVAISVGWAAAEAGMGAAELIRAADRAVYRAKASGGGRS